MTGVLPSVAMGGAEGGASTPGRAVALPGRQETHCGFCDRERAARSRSSVPKRAWRPRRTSAAERLHAGRAPTSDALDGGHGRPGTAEPAGSRWGGKKANGARDRQRRPARPSTWCTKPARGLRRRRVPEPGREASAGAQREPGPQPARTGRADLDGRVLRTFRPVCIAPAGCTVRRGCRWRAVCGPAAGVHHFGLAAGSDERRLKVCGLEAGAGGDALEHLRADLVAIVEGEEIVRPASTFQNSMGTGTAAFLPANSQEGGQHAPGLGGLPVHAAVKLMVSRSSRSEALI